MRDPNQRLGLTLLVSGLILITWALISRPFFDAARAVTAEITFTEPTPGFSLEVVAVAQPKERKGRVFLYHTHTYEAYEMDGDDRYTPTEKWRTADNRYNMIRVGEELKKQLEDAGLTVTHDTTAYEPPRLSTAYARSLVGIQSAAQEGYDLYIDLHRDSYSEGNGPNTVDVKGQKAARLLILIGKGTGTGFDERPDWETNQQCAQFLSDALNAQVPSVCRGVSLKSGRYNQHAATPSMLIEVGNNKNTLSEALNVLPLLTNAICNYFDLAE